MKSQAPFSRRWPIATWQVALSLLVALALGMSLGALAFSGEESSPTERSAATAPGNQQEGGSVADANAEGVASAAELESLYQGFFEAVDAIDPGADYVGYVGLGIFPLGDGRACVIHEYFSGIAAEGWAGEPGWVVSPDRNLAVHAVGSETDFAGQDLPISEYSTESECAAKAAEAIESL